MWMNMRYSVLSIAATTGSKDTFEAVVVALEDKLTPAEVMVEGHNKDSRLFLYIPRHNSMAHPLRLMKLAYDCDGTANTMGCCMLIGKTKSCLCA